MQNKLIPCSLILFIAANLIACSGASDTEEGSTTMTGSASTTSQNASPYNTRITIREIMSSLIDPPADDIWNSVRVVSDSKGITEYAPETDEEWNALRISAVSIIEGANALMMSGRKVAVAGAVGEFPEYEFTPEEVEEALKQDPQSWIGYSRGLQNAAFDVLGAIDLRNSEQLSVSGAFLDEACEACHAHYWYREGI